MHKWKQFTELTRPLRHGSTSFCHRSSSTQPRICIIGSGPAGFYTAHRLLKFHPNVKVDILERLPVPFGLVRFGAAPDHTGIKNVTHHFTKLAQSERCRFIGNVSVGRDVTLSQLQPFYNAVVLAYGVQADKLLGIPGEVYACMTSGVYLSPEELSGVHSARSFVGWYNGMLEHSVLNPDLSGETAVIIGQGNVAVDIARMLVTPVDVLKKTDICEHALEALSRSNIKRVYMVGNGGPLQVTLTTKELREMARIPYCQAQINPLDLARVKGLIEGLPRAKKRLMQLLVRLSEQLLSSREQIPTRNIGRLWGLKFYRKPVEFLKESRDSNRVSGIKMEIICHSEEEGIESSRTLGTGMYEVMNCDLVIRSIGYKSLSVDENLPFDTRKGIIPNVRGRVISGTISNSVIPGLYCSGWVKRGPYGNTPVTMVDGFETADMLLEDLEQGELQGLTYPEDVLDMLNSFPGVTPTSFSDWEKIDRVERENGRLRGKPREKILSLDKMMEIITQTRNWKM